MRKWGRKITSALVAALLAVNLMVPAGVYAAPRFDEGVETESGEPVKDMSAEKLSLTVKAADQEWTYDGEAHSCDDVVIIAGTLLPGHVLSAENSGEVTNVSDSGIGNNTVSFVKIMNGEEDVTALYKIDTQAGNLTITPKKLDGDAIRISDEDIVYDGSKKTPEIVVMDGDKVVPKEEYNEPRYSHNINAGEATVTVRDLEGGNYIVSGSRKFTIKGAPVTVKAYNSSKDYGENDPTLSASVSGILMTDPIDIVYEVDREEGEDAGTYTITPTGDKAQGNYEVIYETGTFTINRKKVSNPTITLSQDEYTYDGTAHEPKVTVKDGEVTIPEDQYTVSYEDNVNAGTAKVTVTGKEIGNYEFSGTKNFTIKKAAVTVKADDKTKEYSAADPELTAAVTGLVANDKISYTLTREEGESAGTYVITPSGDAVQGNYTVQYIPGILTIKEKPRTEYFCKEGDNYVHTKGSKKEMRVVFDSAKGGAEVMKHLTGVYVENDAIPQKFMKLSIGSVIIDVSPEYLDTLSIGEHSLTASFDDGNSVTIKFSVVEADKKENSKTETKKTDAGKTETKKTDKNVATGDDMNMLLIVMLMMSSVAGAACIYKKKKRDK